MNERVYIETSVVSYLTSRPSRDLVIAAHQELTRQWWSDRGGKFDLFVSELVLDEVRRGDQTASANRVDAVENLAILSATPEAVVLAEGILSEGSFPREAGADALHIAIAAVNGME